MVFFAALCFLFVVCALSQLYFHVKRYRLLQQSWGDLLSAIQPVNVTGIAEIAECYLRPSSTQLRVGPDVMWLVIGGFEGLEALNKNAEAMLNLAMYARQWNRVEGRIVSEMIRRDGIRMKRAIRQIQLAMVSQAAVRFAGFELQETLATYQMMRGRLLGLYEVAHTGLYGRLAQRI